MLVATAPPPVSPSVSGLSSVATSTPHGPQVAYRTNSSGVFYLLTYLLGIHDRRHRPTAAGGEHVGSCCRRRSTTRVVCVRSPVSHLCRALEAVEVESSMERNAPRTAERPPPPALYLDDGSTGGGQPPRVAHLIHDARNNHIPPQHQGKGIACSPLRQRFAELGCAVRAVCRVT